MGVFLLLLLYVKFDKYKYRCYLLLQMTANFTDFINDMQSINLFEKQALVLFCDTSNRARAIQQQLIHNFGIYAITDTDKDNFSYVIPLQSIDDKTLSKFIHNGWNWDKNQNFIQYTITLYNEHTTTKIYNMLIARGYNVLLLPNNMQLVVCCLDNSQHDDEMQDLHIELTSTQKSNPMSMDVFFNKVLFNGKIENIKYRKKIKQELELDEIEQNRDLIIREMLYQYFKKRIRPYLKTRTLARKFDANKLDNKLKQNVNLIREFLYTVAERYLDIQVINAIRTRHDSIIRFDYLNGCNDYKDVSKTAKLARKWWSDTARQNIEKERNKKQSMNQAYKVMDCENGYYFVLLYGRDALKFEGKHMHHCLQNDYWANAIKKPEQELYSLRDANGEPHLTLEIENNQVLQCQGRTHTDPNPILRKMVREFIAKNHFEIPDVNTWNKHIAYIKQDGVLYDVFNLPKNFVVTKGNIDLCAMGLDKLPDMSSVIVNTSYNCANNNLTDLTGAPYTVNGDARFIKNPLTSLRGMPRNIGGKIYLSETQLTTKSFVPLYMENKLDDIVGVDDNLIAAWRKQIANRKTEIANIIMALKNHAKE